MSQTKNFEFDQKAAAGPAVIGDFTINGEKYDIRPLKDTHVAYLVRAAQRKRNETAIISAVINFMEQALTAESSARFEDLVLGDPGLEMLQVVEVFQHVLSVVSEGGEATVKKATRSRSGNPAVRSA